MEKYIIIVAGGSGTRFGAPLPKQYVELRGIPILVRTLMQALKVVPVENIITVIPQTDFSLFSEMCTTHKIPTPKLASAGNTRYHSVKSGLETLKKIACGEVLVAIHDGVRPLASSSLFESGFNTASIYGAAVPGIPLIDSVRQVTDNTTKAIDRKTLRAVQTPQVFHLKQLLDAYTNNYNSSFTDDASVVEANGGKIAIFNGEIANIKITTPVDIAIAEYYIDR